MLAADLPELLLSAVDLAAAADGAAPDRSPLRREPALLFRKLGGAPPPAPPADDRGGVVAFSAPLGPPVTSPPPSSSMLSAPFEPADAEFMALLSSNAASATGPVAELDLLFDESVDEVEFARREDIPVTGRIERLRCILSRAAGSGDARRVERILNQVPREFIDLNAKDEEGSAPLIYAACFGHMEVAFLLLEAGADPDIQDKFGWTPLTWATKNNHYAFARMLVEYGAKTSTKTARGRTAMDFARHSDLRLTELFAGNVGRSEPASQGVRPTFDDLEFYSSGGVDEEAFQSERNFMFRMAMDQATGLEKQLQELGAENLGDDSDVDDDSENDRVLSDDDAPFVWDQCLPDQMFVYDPTHLDCLVDAVTGGIKPGRSAGQKPIPANIVFLSARYAHYFCSDEMLDTLLDNVFNKIRQTVTSAKDDLAVFAFWLANTTVLLYYLRRDSGLASATLAHQENLSELIASIYRLLVREAEARLYRILDESIIEYEPIPGLTDGVRFERERRSIFGIGLSRAESPPPTSATAGSAGVAVESSEAAKGRLRSLRESALFRRPHGGGKLPRCPSPKTVTTLFSSILFLLRVYHVHPWLVRDVLSQLFYYMSVVLFNRVLTNSGLRCRSRAMQIRINVAAVEDWARANRAPPATLAHLTPLVELLQFLQCLTQLGDLGTFLETRAKLQSVTPMQIRKVVEGYRYEVREERVPEEVRQYVVQVAEDTETRDRETRAEMVRKSEEERGITAHEQPPGSPAVVGSDRETGEVNESEEPSTGFRGHGDNPPAIRNAEMEAAEVLIDARGEGGPADERFAISDVAAPRIRHAPIPLSLTAGTDAVAPLPRPRRSLAAFSVSTPSPSADLPAPDSPLQEVKDADYLLPFTIPRDRDFAEGWHGRACRRSGSGDSRERVSWLDNPVVPSEMLEILDASEPPRL